MANDRQLLESALLVVRFQRGDGAAFEELVRLWERSLFYYLRRLSSAEADAWELLQETWLNVFRSLGSLRDPQAIVAFLYRTARNAAVSRWRKRVLEQTEPCADEVADEADHISAFDNAEAVHHALDQLPLLQREALTLYFLEDLSLDEMAGVMDVPLGTAKSRLHYGKRAMRRILLGTEGTEGTEREKEL